MYTRTETSFQPRIELTDEMIKNFLKNIFSGTVSELANAKGLSYTLVYNLVHGRIHSLSARDYRIIFGEEPPWQNAKRVDGKLFRDMVKLWLFLNNEVTEADLYREFYRGKDFKRVDYRIFSGEVRTVEKRVEKIMEEKFLDQGLDRSEIREWIYELDQISDSERVLFEEIRPVLEYLQKTLDVNPSRILNQWLWRYESGELKTIPNDVYEYALQLIKRTERAESSGSRFELEKLKEEIYGKRKGLTLYAEVAEELTFLKKYAGKSFSRYLGRSVSSYKRSKLKRIATWRARRIRDDCKTFIERNPKISLLSLPNSHLKMRIGELVSAMKLHLTMRLIGDEAKAYERHLLTPSLYSKEEYEKPEYGFTSMQKAAHALGMSGRAFDLLVTENSDLFRRIGIYDEKWYVPNLYLREISEREGFELIVAKYELLARNGNNLIHSKFVTPKGS